MICQRCLQPFVPGRYGIGYSRVCEKCVEELADEDKNRETAYVPPHCRERDEQPVYPKEQQ